MNTFGLPQDDTGHPELDTLADYSEGLLTTTEAEATAAHVLDCTHCQDALAALAEVADLLTDALPPEPIPAGVAARIDAALLAAAAEQPAPAPTPITDADTDTDERVERVLPSLPPRRHRSRSARLRVALVGLAAAAALGYLGNLVLSSTSTEYHSSSAGSAAVGTAGPHPAGTYQSDVAPGTHARSGAAAHPQTAGSPDAVLPTRTAAVPFTDDAFAAQVRALAAAPSASRPPGCTEQGLGLPSGSPLTASPGSYHDQNVWALVFQGPAGELTGYLIAADCSAPKLLLKRTVPQG